MIRQTQYQNLMFMIKNDWFADTNLSLKKYIEKYKHPIQIGTRLSDLVRSGYLVSTPLWKWRNVWTLTQKGIDWNWEELIIKRSWKVKKTRAESEVKKECKDYPYPTSLSYSAKGYKVDHNVKHWDYVHIDQESMTIKKTRAESEINKECKVFNMDILHNAQKKLKEGNNKPTHIRTEEWKYTLENFKHMSWTFSSDTLDKATELLRTNNWKPKHTFREHVKSLLF